MSLNLASNHYETIKRQLSRKGAEELTSCVLRGLNGDYSRLNEAFEE